MKIPLIQLTQTQLEILGFRRAVMLRMVAAIGVLGVTAALFFGSVHGQQSAAPSSDVIGNWDFSGMTPEQKFDALYLLFPREFYAEYLKNRTPEQKANDDLVAWSALDPVGYGRAFPQIKDPQTMAAEEVAAWAISHPREAEALARLSKTQEQLDAEAFSAWLITHPAEITSATALAKTPEEIAKEQTAVFEITHPVRKPARVVADLPNTRF